MNSKKELRKIILNKRNNIDQKFLQSASYEIFKKIENLKEFNSTKNIFVYLSFSKEIITFDFINKHIKSKNIIVPKIVSEEMKLIQISSLNNLKENCYGILEPYENNIFLEEIDLVITPGISFDKKGYRLGYGKGYYDKYFSYNNYKLSVGVVLDKMLTDSLPIYSNDKKVDIIITEKRQLDLR